MLLSSPPPVKIGIKRKKKAKIHPTAKTRSSESLEYGPSVREGQIREGERFGVGVREFYQGFEQGPIRPPSEAHSLLIRVSRNCPWNRCSFCPVYKNARFSIRPVEHVKQDIDAVRRCVDRLQLFVGSAGHLAPGSAREALAAAPDEDPRAWVAAVHWVQDGLRSVFLQDANALMTRTQDLIEILCHLREAFPKIERITTYARAHTAATRDVAELKALREAGLNRMHIGLESGSDAVLSMIQKGVDKARHIAAGLKIKEAGFELSEYVMPGLGGRPLSRDHAIETADAISRIDPHFIRLRTLAIAPQTPLFEEWSAGRFDPCTDIEVAGEIRLFLESLNGLSGEVRSDHILNLFGDLEGRLPDDKPRMIGILESFLALDPEEQILYQVGRRMGMFSSLSDLESPRRRAAALGVCREYGITPENADTVIRSLMQKFI